MRDLSAMPSGHVGLNARARFDADSSDPRPHPMTAMGDKIEPQPNGCWIWTGSVNDAGYGVSQGSRRGIALGAGPLVHRIVYTILAGPIPDEHVLHHECEVRACVNPEHLTPMTNGDHLSHHAELRRSA